MRGRRIRAVSGLIGPQDEGQRIHIEIDAEIAAVTHNPHGTAVSLYVRSLDARHYDGHDSVTKWQFRGERPELPLIFLQDLEERHDGGE